VASGVVPAGIRGSARSAEFSVSLSLDASVSFLLGTVVGRSGLAEEDSRGGNSPADAGGGGGGTVTCACFGWPQEVSRAISNRTPQTERTAESVHAVRAIKLATCRAAPQIEGERSLAP